MDTDTGHEIRPLGWLNTSMADYGERPGGVATPLPVAQVRPRAPGSFGVVRATPCDRGRKSITIEAAFEQERNRSRLYQDRRTGRASPSMVMVGWIVRLPVSTTRTGGSRSGRGCGLRWLRRGLGWCRLSRLGRRMRRCGLRRLRRRWRRCALRSKRRNARWRRCGRCDGVGNSGRRGDLRRRRRR